MKGVLLFAFNSPTVDYYAMAIATAKRAAHFLHLPVSVVTDSATDLSKYNYKFDHVFIVNSDRTNYKSNTLWINTGRFQAYDLTPYDETLLIDTDYLINSNTLLRIFDIYDDFMCPSDVSYVLHEKTPDEMVSPSSFKTLWATVIAFKKTEKTKQIFECIKMVQENYSHYVNLYNIVSTTFRNDYALTIALRIVYGQLEDKTNYIPWNLLHVSSEVQMHRNSSKKYNTSYTAIRETPVRGKVRTEYNILNNTDFHLLNKKTFMELVNE
jgi:hypothetical protein